MKPSRVILFIALPSILSGSSLFGQGWTDDGTVVRLTTSTDNVGIGTTAPTTKLDVAGTVTATLFHTGIDNSLFGNLAGPSITTGVNNAFFGEYAGYLNTTGSGNSFFGQSTGFSNTSGVDNAFFGDDAGFSNTTGYSNSFFGKGAGLSNTTGTYNAFFGENAGYYNTSGNYNSFFGRHAGYSNTTGNRNAFFGKDVGYYNTTGYENSFFGHLAGNSNTTGNRNAFFGKDAGFSNTTGVDNSFFGHLAGNSNTTGNRNAFFGKDAGFSNTTAADNSFFGQAAGYSNTTGFTNSFFGGNAGSGNTTGSSNSFFGQFSGDLNTTGNANSFFGKQAGFSNTTGGYNSFFGEYAGGDNTTGTQRTAVGQSANSIGAAYNNNTGLGYNADCTAANQVRIGNSSVTSIGGYANWTNISDSRFKKNVQEDVKGLDFIMALRPVSYNLDLHGVENFIADHYGERPTETLPEQYEKESIRQSGFIAQEVEATAKALGYDFSGVDAPKSADDFYGLRYAEFVVPLVKAVQEQQEMIQDQQATIGLLIAALEKNGIEVGILKGKGKETPRKESKNSGSEIIKNPARAVDLGALPTDFGISNNYPNPFNPSTTIEYALPSASQVTIKVYNSLGQEVRTLVDGFQEAGYKSVVWDGKNYAGSPVASGTYVYRVVSGNSVKSEKMILTK